MGGSGGRYLTRFSAEQFQRVVEEAGQQAENAEFESAANELVGAYLAQFNDRDVEGIRRILERVKAELGEEIEGTVDLLFGGSVAKKTYVDGLSDVDSLLLINREGAADQTPEQIKEVCAARLRELFGDENVSVGRLAVTVERDGKTLQFLPAVRSGEHFKISNPEGTAWARIRPRLFADALSEANGAMGNKLVPTIKLAKAILGQLPDERRLSGYHVEALAVRIFRGYEGDKTPRRMLRHFFDKVGAALQSPINDVTGQSDFVDEYLGPANSISRRVMADTCDRIGRRIKAADSAQDTGLWKQLFGEETR